MQQCSAHFEQCIIEAKLTKINGVEPRAAGEYRHRVTFSPTQYPALQAVYMRVFIRDPLLPDTTQISQDASLMHIKRYFSWQVVN